MRALFLPILLTLSACGQETATSPSISVQQALGGVADESFLRATHSREFTFPHDHGPHDGYRNEWWYLTGNLATGQDRSFGFQVTFFRIAITPHESEKRASRWSATHVWMAHVALTDPERQSHFAHEQFAREALGLAGAQNQPYAIWVGDWRLAGGTDDLPWRLDIKADDFSLDLELDAVRPPILQGRNGLSRKSAKRGNASYYYSISRLDTQGTLSVLDQKFAVSGLAWLDREWSTSSLGPNQVGWDWFSMQLLDGSDLMFYHLRDHEGNTDQFSAGSILGSGRKKTELKTTDVVLTPERWWKSESGTRYPVAWTMYVKPLGKKLRIEAVLDNQEMALSVNYWEGMIKVTESDQVVGYGYLEMTGYE